MIWDEVTVPEVGGDGLSRGPRRWEPARAPRCIVERRCHGCLSLVEKIVT
jgi:hypothetical protein